MQFLTPSRMQLTSQILMSILSSFRTLELLPMAPTSQRFHLLILRLLYHRLRDSAQLKDHKLILECFHPSTKLSTPYLFCDFICTRALDAAFDFDDIQGEDGTIGNLGKMNQLYTHFRPLKPDHERKAIRQHPAGGSFEVPNGLVDQHDEFICQNIHLESHELFSQLCTITNLVKVGPKRGLFLSCVNISEGITRIWRNWLAERAAFKPSHDGGASSAAAKERSERLLWADNNKTVGLRIGVVEREDDTPVLVRKDEDAPVSYTLQYERTCTACFPRRHS